MLLRDPATAPSPTLAPAWSRRNVSRALLVALASDRAPSVLVSHDRPRFIPGGVTRIALRTWDGALVVVALRGYVEGAVARRLAGLIADALWRTRYRVRRWPGAMHIIGPHNVDGRGTPLPTWSSVGHLLNRTPQER